MNSNLQQTILKQSAFFVLFFISIQCFGNKIEFMTDFDQAVQLAQKQNKLIFVDAMADWCGPCKMLDKHIFTEDKLADFHNEHFINVKIDADKNVSFKQKYGIRAYPTMLYLYPNAKEINRAMGVLPAGELLNIGHKAKKDFEIVHVKLNEVHKVSEKKIITYLDKIGKKHGQDAKTKLANAYLEKKKNFNSEVRLKIVQALLPNLSEINFVHYYKPLLKKNELSDKERGELIDVAYHVADKNAQKTAHLLQQVGFSKAKAYTAEKRAFELIKKRYTSLEEAKESFSGLLLNCPNTTDLELLKMATIFTITHNQNKEEVSSIYEAMSSAFTSTDASIIQLDCLSAVAYKLGDKEQSKTFLARAFSKADETNVKFKSIFEKQKKKIKILSK